ncbi:hypothetical protein [Marinomonas sp. 2405UD68-3]|uniref:hypothetical protein n=1 Tax=Marinomonas sp. 2405UD68-3 TaxID=3391835 RepID=UPI0039C90C29
MTDNIVISPALFARYFLKSDASKKIPTKAPINKGNFHELIIDYIGRERSNDYDIEMHLTDSIFSRDFLVLLALFKIERSDLSIHSIDGGFSFLATDIRETLNLTNSGSNSDSIEQSIQRLSEIEFAIVAISKNEANDDIELHTGRIVDTFSTRTSSKGMRDRSWFVKLSDEFKLFRKHCEIVKHNMEDLLKCRKSATNIAIQAHIQTVSHNKNKTYAKKVTTLFKNINSEINSNKWVSDRHYRQKIGALVKNAARRILNIAYTPPKKLFRLFTSKIAFHKQPASQ